MGMLAERAEPSAPQQGGRATALFAGFTQALLS